MAGWNRQALNFWASSLSYPLEYCSQVCSFIICMTCYSRNFFRVFLLFALLLLQVSFDGNSWSMKAFLHFLVFYFGNPELIGCSVVGSRPFWLMYIQVVWYHLSSCILSGAITSDGWKIMPGHKWFTWFSLKPMLIWEDKQRNFTMKVEYAMGEQYPQLSQFALDPWPSKKRCISKPYIRNRPKKPPIRSQVRPSGLLL